jgi:hypothetical protein
MDEQKTFIKRFGFLLYINTTIGKIALMPDAMLTANTIIDCTADKEDGEYSIEAAEAAMSCTMMATIEKTGEGALYIVSKLESIFHSIAEK